MTEDEDRSTEYIGVSPPCTNLYIHTAKTTVGKKLTAIILVITPTYSIQISANSADVYGALWQKTDVKCCIVWSPTKSTALIIIL